MTQTSSLQTLDLILEDISAEINLSISSLERYRQDPKGLKYLKKCKAHLNRLKGVFALLDMPSANRLVIDTIKVVSSLTKCKQETKQRYLEALSVALIRLSRYCEHVNHKESALPELLLPTINELRTAINVQQLDESVFFHGNSNKSRENKRVALITSEEDAAKSRHYRQMYQIGLIEVLRQTNLNGGLSMMKKSLAKLDEECPRPTSPNLWWIAQAMMDAYKEQGIVLTKTRLKLFSRLDRQICYLENKPVYRLDDNKQETQRLAQEMLYLTWISQSETKLITRLLAHFDLPAALVGDKRLREESDELRGPSDQDYNSIAEALLEEIEKIEKSLIQADEKDLALLDLEQAMNQMVTLNNLLKILQVDDQIVRLSVAIDLIEKAIARKTNLTSKDSNILFLVLKSIREAVGESKLAKYSGKTRKQRNRISAAQLEICEATEVLVKELIRDVSLFTEQKRKRQHLVNVEQLILDLQSGFKQLKITKADPILRVCLNFVKTHLIRSPQATSQQSIEFFADIISSFEFYLETLKYTSEPSSRILEFAENSLSQLQTSLKVDFSKKAKA
jgi:hypothetical protein